MTSTTQTTQTTQTDLDLIRATLDACLEEAVRQGLEDEQAQRDWVPTAGDLDCVVASLGRKPTASEWRAVGFGWVGSNHCATDSEECACGCGQMTTRTVRMLPAGDVGTAEALGWAEMSIAPMRHRVHVADGHEDDVTDYVAR